MSLASVSGTIELLINFSINLSRWQINIRTDVWETFGRPLPPGHLACTWPQRIPHLAEAAKTSGGATTFSLSLSLLAQLTHGCPFNQVWRGEKSSASIETIQASLQSKWVKASTWSACKTGKVAKRHLALCRAKTCQDLLDDIKSTYKSG